MKRLIAMVMAATAVIGCANPKSEDAFIQLAETCKAQHGRITIEVRKHTFGNEVAMLCEFRE